MISKLPFAGNNASDKSTRNLNPLKLWLTFGFFFVLIVGTLSHFVYNWSGKNFWVGFFFPINESTWEHMKLLYFPMLVCSFLLIPLLRKHYPCISSSLLAGILIGTFLIPTIFYTYTGILGYHIAILDICTFILSVFIAFLVVYRLTLSCRLKSFTAELSLAIVILGIYFLLFTYLQPDLGIFVDPIYR